jgi:hypothetical protein
VIAVFVRNQHGIDAVGILANGFEPIRNFLPAHTSVEQ